MLAGIPAPYVLALMAVATVFGFGSAMFSKVAGCVVVAAVVVVWLILAFVYSQDRTRVPVVLLGLRHRFAKRVTSFSPEYPAVRVEED